MENATDALKIAFAVLVFMMAISVFVIMFAQLNDVSRLVISVTDITNFYEYEKADAEKTSRIVGLETIIPTLYKYYKENYTVLFLDESGNPLPLYTSKTDIKLWGTGIDPATNKNSNEGIIGKYYTDNKSSYSLNDSKPVCSFDVDEETVRHEPWTGSTKDYKANLDAFLYGGKFEYPSKMLDSNGNIKAYNYKDELGNGGFCGKYNNRKFQEFLGEYTYNVTGENTNENNNLSNQLLKNRKKRVIIYRLQPY